MNNSKTETMKTVEELLRPRYKVIADYPQNSLKVGDIISFELQHVEIAQYAALNGSPIRLAVMEKEVKNYPHLFQPLPWWSDRKVEDMPEFVKLKNMKDEIEVHKVQQWNERNGMPFVEGFGTMVVREMTPATREEYELFKQQKGK